MASIHCSWRKVLFLLFVFTFSTSFAICSPTPVQERDLNESSPAPGTPGTPSANEEKGGIYEVGREFKEAGHEVAKGFKKVGRGVKTGAVKTGGAFKKVGRKIKNFFTGEKEAPKQAQEQNNATENHLDHVGDEAKPARN